MWDELTLPPREEDVAAATRRLLAAPAGPSLAAAGGP